jgi:hypothetical protein
MQESRRSIGNSIRRQAGLGYFRPCSREERLTVLSIIDRLRKENRDVG